MTLEEMKAVDIRTVKREDLVDIRDVHIDRTLPKEERIKDFIRQINRDFTSAEHYLFHFIFVGSQSRVAHNGFKTSFAEILRC